jgi:hypothetical protein
VKISRTIICRKALVWKLSSLPTDVGVCILLIVRAVTLAFFPIRQETILPLGSDADSVVYVLQRHPQQRERSIGSIDWSDLHDSISTENR